MEQCLPVLSSKDYLGVICHGEEKEEEVSVNYCPVPTVPISPSIHAQTQLGVMVVARECPASHNI